VNESPDQQEVPTARAIPTAPALEAAPDDVALPYASSAPDPPRSAALIVSQPWRTTVLDLVLACVAFFGVLIGLEYLCGSLFREGPEGPPPGRWVMVAQRGLLSVWIGLVLYLLLRKRGQPVGGLGLRPDGNVQALLWGLLAYVVMIVYVMGLGYVVGTFWPEARDGVDRSHEHLLTKLPEMGPAVAVLFSLVVAVSEELFFRGFVVTRVRCLTRSWTLSVVLSSAVFAGLHLAQGWLAAALIFGVSVMLGFWLIWRGNVLVPIVAHTLFDTTTLVYLDEVVR